MIIRGFMTGLALALWSVAISANAETFYVDATGGNDANTGTSTVSAWQTLSKVNAEVLVPGDIVLLKRGETWAERLDVRESGTATSTIRFGSYGSGDKPTIEPASGRAIDIRGVSYVDFADLKAISSSSDAIFLFSPASSNLTFTDVEMASSSGGFNSQAANTNITVTRATSTNVGTSFAPNAMMDSRFEYISIVGGGTGFSWSDQTTTDLVIADSRIASTSGHGISFSRCTGTITVRDSEIESAGDRGISLSSSFGDCDAVTLDGVTITGSGSYGLIDQIGVDELTIMDTRIASNGDHGIYVTVANDDLSVSSSTISGNGGTGIFIGPDSITTLRDLALNANDGNGLLVSGNSSTSAERVEASNNGNDGFNIRDMAHLVCTRCVAKDNGIDGIGADGDGYSWHDASTGRLIRSEAHDNKKSALANINTSAVILRSNLFTHASSGTLSLIGLYDTASANIANTTLINTSQEGTAITFSSGASGQLVNSLIQGFDFGIVDGGTGGALTATHNWIYGAGSDAFSGFVPDSASSSTTDPLLTDVSGGTYTLQSTSPAINAGTSTDRTFDFAGLSISGLDDIGAHEYQIISPTAAFTTGISGRTVTFSDDSTDADGSVVDWSWSFGDGGTSAVQNPQYNYTSNGTYTTTLVVTDNHGATGTTTAALSVSQSSSGSGGSVRYGCHDETAVNYDRFSRSDPSLCVYPNQQAGTSLEALQKRLAELQLQLAALLSNDGTNCPFLRNLQVHSTGDDVNCLQRFLNGNGFPLVTTGPGSAGNETDYFGQLTFDALVRFQNEHTADILLPAGISSGSGFFGPITRAFVQALRS